MISRDTSQSAIYLFQKRASGKCLHLIETASFILIFVINQAIAAMLTSQYNVILMSKYVSNSNCINHIHNRTQYKMQ